MELIYLINSTSPKKQSRVRTKIRPNRGFVPLDLVGSNQFMQDLIQLSRIPLKYNNVSIYKS
ncbi:hypothetical protein BDD43_4205 [Mucilaginibacter gracilis]|uniref:Uncharacterized protein n=1 Tax=Mucilaginibacter gracilis TaxID=423350 RepID=A0A495J7J8_9SPHI|nr:hypothetical protein BDD43_4205 [Mucilaginibacter gracilis]